eukprot:10331402-Heterocapsa_arctica.AAC.1
MRRRERRRDVSRERGEWGCCGAKATPWNRSMAVAISDAVKPVSSFLGEQLVHTGVCEDTGIAARSS